MLNAFIMLSSNNIISHAIGNSAHNLIWGNYLKGD